MATREVLGALRGAKGMAMQVLAAVSIDEYHRPCARC